MLSHMGKEIFIKAMAEAIPMYIMSIFKILNTLYDEMTSMVRNFWWGQMDGKTKMAWLSWDKVCTSKEEGGLGFRDFKAFNFALLAKQGWRLQTYTSSLVHRVLKARYFLNSDFLGAVLGSLPSFAWRSMMVAQKNCQTRL